MEARRERPTAERRRRMACVVAGAFALGVLGGCSQPADPGAGVAAEEDLDGLADRVDELEDQLAEVQERVGDLEDGAPEGDEEPDATGSGTAGPTAGPTADPTGAVFDDRGSAIGDQVTVRTTVADVIPTTSLGSAFRVEGRSGDPVPVLSATAAEGIDPDDVVEVTGAVVRVDPDTFEEDFGIDEDELLEDASAFFEQSEGSIALSATDVRIVQDAEG